MHQTSQTTHPIYQFTTTSPSCTLIQNMSQYLLWWTTRHTFLLVVVRFSVLHKNKFTCSFYTKNSVLNHWHHQLWGTGARAPLDVQEFFSLHFELYKVWPFACPAVCVVGQQSCCPGDPLASNPGDAIAAASISKITFRRAECSAARWCVVVWCKVTVWSAHKMSIMAVS